MNKILLLSENNSIWTKRCLEHSGILGRSRIWSLSLTSSEYDSYYRKNGIKLCIVKKHSLLGNIPKVRGLVQILEYIRCVRDLQKRAGGFDVVHISYITREKMLALRLLRKKTKKIVCTFWGSDLFRVPDRELLRYRKALETADVIMLSTAEMRERFISVFGRRSSRRILSLKFGIESLEHIDFRNTQNAKRLLGIPEDKTVITVGYNGKECHNHIRVIEALNRLPKEQKDRLFIQIPATYGLTPEYRQRLTAALKKLGCEYCLTEDFLDDESLCRLRESSDIFIHAQTTDAFSGSVQEYLFARKLVFNPVWIQYRDMQQKGIWYREYRDYGELVRMLSEYLEKGISEDEKKKIARNTELIRELSSWEALSEKWQELYRVNK